MKLPVYQFFLKSFRSIGCVILLVIPLGRLWGQVDERSDSLQQVITTSQGLDKFDPTIELAKHYVSSDKTLSLENFEKAKVIALEYGDTVKIVKAGRLLGEVLRRYERINEAIEELNEVLRIARRNNLTSDLKYILNSLATAHTFRADYDEALTYHFESLIIREEAGDAGETSIALNNIGLVYFKLKNYERSIEFYNRCLQLKRETNDKSDLDRLLINIGLGYNQLKDFQRAQKYFTEAFSVCSNECSDEIRVEGKFGLGVSYFEEKKFEMALRHFKESLEIAKNIEYKRFQAENLLNIGIVFLETGQIDSAAVFFKESENVATESTYNEILIENYKYLSKLYGKTNDFQNALNYQNKYIDLKDRVYSEHLIENIAKVQTRYAERENIATIAAKEQMIKQQSDLNVAIAVIAILAGLLILVLQRGNRNIKQVNAKLSEAKETIQEQNRLLEGKNKDLDRQVAEKTIDLERVNSSLKQVNDELDNFIYKTSHDIRGPLASLKGMCNVALLDVKDPIALDYLRKLDTTAERLNTILTRLLIINQINNSKLSVSPIDFEGVVNDVLMLERKKGLPQKLRISKQIDGDAVIHSDKELVRIVLENLVDNSIKFYNDSDRVDSFVEVRIAALNGGAVKVSVIDNGIGISESDPGKLFQMFFRASERSEIGGIGLYIVKTATSKLGGRVGLQTTEEGYTEFYVTFPKFPSQADDIPEKGHFF